MVKRNYKLLEVDGERHYFTKGVAAQIPEASDIVPGIYILELGIRNPREAREVVYSGKDWELIVPSDQFGKLGGPEILVARNNHKRISLINNPLLSEMHKSGRDLRTKTELKREGFTPVSDLWNRKVFVRDVDGNKKTYASLPLEGTGGIFMRVEEVEEVPKITISMLEKAGYDIRTGEQLELEGFIPDPSLRPLNGCEGDNQFVYRKGDEIFVALPDFLFPPGYCTKVYKDNNGHFQPFINPKKIQT